MDNTTGRIQVSAPDFSVEALDELWMHIVLVQPEIPQNSGSVARLCAASKAWLHLVKPLGYVLEDRYLKRAGLDYWPNVRLSVHEDLDALEALLPRERTWLFTKSGTALHYEVAYPRGAVLVFGRESSGLPPEFVERWGARTTRLPLSRWVRSLNLANAASVAAYEVLRQHGWSGESPMDS